jgi:coproporphyrinogen III oxidase
MIEREIIIGLITSTEYCSNIKGLWNDLYIESATGKRLSAWCWEYFDEYHKAPKRNIEKIYFAKLKEGKLNKDLFTEIEEDILPGLSKEYENSDFNLQRLVKKTNEYFSQRHLKIYAETLQALTEAGKIEEA